MGKNDKIKSSFTRRDFLALTSGVAASALLNQTVSAAPKNSAKRKSSLQNKPLRKRPNILFIFTDQERFFDQLPSAFPLPGHEMLAKKGTRFTSHQISSCMCTSSRSIMLTGLQTADNGMFENVDMPWVQNLSTQIPTFGHMLRKVGYYTAYKGKWHLNRDFENKDFKNDLNKEMEKYGFADFYSPGDSLAHTLGGYDFDHFIGGGAISWLRRKGRPLSDSGQPWSLTVSLINPHDIMYFNADAPNENFQDTGKLLMHAERAPEHALYRKDWKYPLPASLRQPLEQPGRPKAHAEYSKAWAYCLGNIPLKEANWHRFTNFYLNSIRSVDYQLQVILGELENLGLAENTVVVFTADHGEMGGSHGLRGKGPFAYKENLNVPLYVIHPDVAGGNDCSALTSHIDLVPSFLSMAGIAKNDIHTVAGRNLPGNDLTTALTNPSAAPVNAVRDHALYTYSGISTNDSEVIRIVAEAKAAGQNPKDALQRSGYKPDFNKRGSVRSVFDGRYKFTRYFAPIKRNSPKNLDELFANNDVELFDLKNDPAEMRNLAMDTKGHAALLMAMNAKLEAAIAQEIGVDDGRDMPNFPGIKWSFERMDL